MTLLRRCALPALIVLITSCLWGQTQPPELRTGVWRGLRVTYAWVVGKNGIGKAVYQGDILLDHVDQSPSGHQSQSIGIAYTQYLWPKVGNEYQIPYVIDPNSGDMANLNTAISQFNSTFSGIIQLVPHSTETDYVDFDFDADNMSGSCEAFEGRVGGEQVVGGSGTCTVATILHEMGHTVGVWHEQSRSDRNTYVNVNYGAVIKGSRGNFDQISDNQQLLTPYDYASVMEYPAFSFSRNGEPCIESIPAGIPLSNSTGYSAADIDGILRLYGAIPTQVTVTSNPPGLQVIVDGALITTPQTFAWALNSTHTLNVAFAPQTVGGVNYIYGRWNDSTAESHTITVTPGNNMVTQPATSPAVTVYSANFIQLVPYVNSVSPGGTGTVVGSPAPQTYSGISGQYYIIRQLVTLTATPSAGQNFYNYIGSPGNFNLPGGTGANPKTFYVSDSSTSNINIITYFTGSPVYSVTTNPVASNLYIYADNTFWYAPKNFALPYDSGWTPSSSHPVNVDSPEEPWSFNSRFEFSSWSDGGAQSHNITLPSSGGASFSANLTPNYFVDDYAVEGTCAASISVTPGSPTGDGFYPAGSLLSFGETPASGLSFTGWLYDLSGTASPQNLAVNDEVLVAADYNVNSTPLTITSLSPASVAAGGGSFTLTINGTGFTNNTYVYINGLYRAIATFVSATKVTIPITATDIATPGAFQVAVGNFNSAGCGPYVPTTFYVLIGSGGGTPTATISPKTLAFGSLAAGTVSASKSVTLTNSGSGALPITSIVASGDFSQSNNCAGSLAAKTSCTVNVTFNPTLAGAITGALTFNDGATTSPQVVKMTGTGVVPLTFSPTSLTLPAAAVGATSTASVTVANKQTTAISLSPITTPYYSVTGGTCTSSLAAGANCSLTITFAPQYKGSIKGALAITTNGAFSPQVVGLAGTSTGGPTVPLSFSPATLTFSATGIGAASAAKIVTVTNKSTGSININSITASPDYAAVGGGTTPCGGALAKSAKCTLSVTFTPSATGAIKGAVAIATSGVGSPQIIGLSGTGEIPVVLSPTSLAFGTQAVGSTSAPKSVTLTNNSGATLTISSIAASGDFSAAPSGSTPCGSTVAVGATCTFSVTFTPNVTGAISGAATVSHSAPLGPAVIKLTGTGH